MRPILPLKAKVPKSPEEAALLAQSAAQVAQKAAQAVQEAQEAVLAQLALLQSVLKF